MSVALHSVRANSHRLVASTGVGNGSPHATCAVEPSTQDLQPKRGGVLNVWGHGASNPYRTRPWGDSHPPSGRWVEGSEELRSAWRRSSRAERESVMKLRASQLVADNSPERGA